MRRLLLFSLLGVLLSSAFGCGNKPKEPPPKHPSRLIKPKGAWLREPGSARAICLTCRTHEGRAASEAVVPGC